jgi:hypothetical protein
MSERHRITDAPPLHNNTSTFRLDMRSILQLHRHPVSAEVVEHRLPEVVVADHSSLVVDLRRLAVAVVVAGSCVIKNIGERERISVSCCNIKGVGCEVLT